MRVHYSGGYMEGRVVALNDESLLVQTASAEMPVHLPVPFCPAFGQRAKDQLGRPLGSVKVVPTTPAGYRELLA